MHSKFSARILLGLSNSLAPVFAGIIGLFATDVFAADVTSTWSTAAAGTWNVNANWTNVPAVGGFPNNGNGGVATYDAVISPVGAPYTVTLNTDVTVEDLSLNSANATLSHTAGMLTATGAINLTAGTYSLAGGTIAGSTVNATVPISIANPGGGSPGPVGTLSGVTVNGDLSFPNNFSRGLIAGGTTFSTAHLLGLASEIGFAPAQTLSGTIQFEGGGGNVRYVSMGTAGSLTVGASGVIKTVAGLTGDATVGAGFNFTGAMALTNNGLISSEVSGRTLTVNPATSFANGATGTLQATGGGILTISAATWTNAGMISVNAATVNLGGTFNATGGIGTWSNTDGTVNVTGTITNTASTLTLNNATGSWNMLGGTINGGTLALTDGKTLNFANPIGGNPGPVGTLSGVTVNGDLSFPNNFSRGLIAGGTTFSTAHLLGLASEIGFAPAQTLTGKIQFEGGGGNVRYVSMSTAGSLTVGATGVIKTVAGLTGDATVGAGFNFTAAMALTNNGLISSEVSGRTLTVNPATSFANGATGTLQATGGGILTISAATWTNAGMISVNAATVNLGGTFNATGGIGTWSNTDGTVNVTGTITNTASTLTLNNATGSWNMLGGTINGGTLALTDGKTLNFANPGGGSPGPVGTLSGVTVNGDLSFPNNFSRGLIAGGTTFSTAHLLGLASEIGFAPAQTLSGTIQFEGGGGNVRYVSMGTAGSLTVGASGVIKTVAGLTGDATVGAGFNFTGAMALTNNGLISSEVSGRTLTVNPATSFANGATGTLQATGGGILTISAATWTNAGMISVNAATVNLGGTFNATGGIGTWSNTDGTVNVTGTITNTASTLTLNNATGSWNMLGGTINGGTLALTDGKTLNFANPIGGNPGPVGTLSGVTVNGDLSFPNNFSRGLIAGGTTFSTAHLLGLASEIGFAPAQTLTGKIQFEGGGGNVRYVSMSTAGSLTVGATGVIKTVAGLTGDATVGAGFNFTAAMALTNNGLISSQVSGRTLTINPATSFSNAGTVEAINGGSLVIPLGYTQTAGTTRLGGGGTISALNGVTLNTITVAGGQLEANGTITANVANSGTIAISPGLAAGTLPITGDLTLAATSALQIEIGGANQGTNYDFLTEAGTIPLNLAGTLSVTLLNGFVPANADSFIVLTSNQPITGTFSNLVNGRVTATDGINTLGVAVIGNVVVLAKLPGDYNGDGIVDAADYVVWRNGLGSTYIQAHYEVWKANFGKTAGSGSGATAVLPSGAAVPEPVTLVLLLAGMPTLFFHRRTLAQ